MPAAGIWVQIIEVWIIEVWIIEVQIIDDLIHYLLEESAITLFNR
jgi:hypothetical protein